MMQTNQNKSPQKVKIKVAGRIPEDQPCSIGILHFYFPCSHTRSINNFKPLFPT